MTQAVAPVNARPTKSEPRHLELRPPMKEVLATEYINIYAGIENTTETIGAHITTIVYLRILIQIGSTFLLMRVEP